DERIADLSLRLNDAPGAVNWYQKAADLQALEAGPLVRYAEALWKAGNAEAARAALTRALEKDPGSAAAEAMERGIKEKYGGGGVGGGGGGEERGGSSTRRTRRLPWLSPPLTRRHANSPPAPVHLSATER